MPREVFTAGQVLTAAELNVVSDQSVMVFAGTAARGSAIPSPTEGMVTYLEDADELQVYTTDWGAVGASLTILQVVSTVKTDTFSTTSSSFTDVTGLTVSITPSSASNKVLVMANVQHGSSNDTGSFGFRLNGGNADDYVGDAASNRTRGVFGTENVGLGLERPDLNVFTASMIYLDSPATTSSITYAVQVRRDGGTHYVNRSGLDSDNSKYTRGASSITVMEVAG